MNKHPQDIQRLLANKTDTPIEIIESLWGTIVYELYLRERMLLLLEDQHRWLSMKNIQKKTIYFKATEEVHPQGITITR